MVGGFVQQQDVRLADQRLAQRGPPPPAAGQLGHAGVARQLQLADGRLHPLLQLPAVPRLQLMLHAGQRRHVRRGAVLQQVVVLGQQAAGLGQPRRHHVVDGLLVGARQGLLQPGQAGAGPQPAFAGIQRDFPGQHPQQGGLAGPVAAQQANFFPARNAHVHPVQENQVAIVQDGFVETQERHEEVG